MGFPGTGRTGERAIRAVELPPTATRIAPIFVSDVRLTTVEHELAGSDSGCGVPVTALQRGVLDSEEVIATRLQRRRPVVDGIETVFDRCPGSDGYE